MTSRPTLKNASVPRADYAPLTPVTLSAPDYPVAAIGSGVEGSILVCFTVQADGSVIRPQIKAVSSEAVEQYFGKGALASITHWKFHPWIVDGKPVSIAGVCEPLNYGNSNAAANGGHVPLTPMDRARSIYPRPALDRGVGGTILVCFTVEADGSVADARVKSASSREANKYLGKATVKTVSKWKFYPWLMDGKAVATTGVCKTIGYALF